jgi:hypothetical protein
VASAGQARLLRVAAIRRIAHRLGQQADAGGPSHSIRPSSSGTTRSARSAAMPMPHIRGGKRMFPATVSQGNRAEDWSIVATSRISAGSSITSHPPISAPLAVTASSPATIRGSVMRPHPDGRRMATNRLAEISGVNPRSNSASELDVTRFGGQVLCITGRRSHPENEEPVP